MPRRTLGFCALYCLALAAGRATAQPDTHIALFWPAAGVGVLWALRTVSRRELAVAVSLTGICAAIGNALTGFTLAPGLTLGLANLTISLLTAVLYRRSRGDLDRRATSRPMLELYCLVCAACAATAASTVLGLAAVALQNGSVSWSVAAAWFVRNLASVVVVVGATRLTPRSTHRPTQRHVAESFAIFASIAVLTWWVFAPYQNLPLAFLPLGLLMWAGIRLPLPLTAAAGALIAVLTLGRLVSGGGGPFAAIADPSLQALVLQGYMLLVAFLALTFGTYRAELRALVSAVQREHQWSDQLIASAPSGLLVMRPTGHILQANRAVGEILRRDLHDLLDIRGDSLDDDADPAAGLAIMLDAALHSRPEAVSTEWVVRAPDGDLLTLSCGARAVTGPDGDLVVLVNVVDVSERRANERRHAHDAAHDPLTGLANRRQLDTLIARHHRSTHARPRGALLLIDLDHFKTVNDTQGHAAGDLLLTEIAALLRRTVGARGTVGRRGGDEFEVLLPDAGPPAAEALAWALVAAVGAHGRRTEGAHGCAVTASIGIATFGPAHATSQDVEALADRAMYAAKRTGGNKARIWQGSAQRVTSPFGAVDSRLFH